MALTDYNSRIEHLRSPSAKSILQSQDAVDIPRCKEIVKGNNIDPP